MFPNSTFCKFIICLTVLVNVADCEFCGYPFQALSRWFMPIHYDVDLNLSMLEHSHTGQVKILFNSLGPRDARRYIIMHAGSNLTIDNVKLYRIVNRMPLRRINDYSFEEVLMNPTMKIKKVCHDDKYEILVIELDESEVLNNVQASNIAAVIDFKATTTINGQGLVRVGYNDPIAMAHSKRILYTKFDRFKAHFVFPCFDDPRHKATFKLTLSNINVGEHAFSTYILDHNELVQNGNQSYMKYVFQRAFPISINQLGFVIGKLDYKKIATIPGVTIAINLMKTDGFRMESKASEDLLKNVFTKLHTFLDTRYSLIYLNFVVHPGIGRAFESHMAGLSVVDSNAVIRAGPLAADEETEIVAKMIEVMARQWFGYMITQEQDEESWFFDGLIGWIVLRLTDQISSGASYEMIFAKRHLSKALDADSQSDVTPLLADADYKMAISDIIGEAERDEGVPRSKFIADAASRASQYPYWIAKRGDYALNSAKRVKATSLFMAYENLCFVDFSQVVVNYLRRYRGKMGHAREFMWLVLNDCRWQPQKFNELSLNLPGFSLIKANIEAPNTFILSQERFLADYSRAFQLRYDAESSLHKPHHLLQFWSMPVSYAYGDHQVQSQIKFKTRYFDAKKTDEIMLAKSFDFTKTWSWLKVNFGARGFYRVLYSDQTLNSLLIATTYNILSDIDSFNLLDDAFAIFKSCKRGAYYLVLTLRAVSKRPNEFIQETSVRAFKEVKKLYTQLEKVNDELGNMGVALFGHVYLEHKFSMDDLITRDGISARMQIYELLAQLDYAPLVTESVEMFRSSELAKLDDRFHLAMFISVARQGSDNDFVEMIVHLESPMVERSDELDSKIVVGLAYATEVPKLQLAWRQVKKMSSNLMELFIATLLDTPEGQKFALQDVVQELPEIHHLFEPERYLALVEQLCNQLAKNTRMCWASSPIGEIVGKDRWNSMMVSVKETRRRNFYLQQLDLNKLVF